TAAASCGESGARGETIRDTSASPTDSRSATRKSAAFTACAECAGHDQDSEYNASAEPSGRSSGDRNPSGPSKSARVQSCAAGEWAGGTPGYAACESLAARAPSGAVARAATSTASGPQSSNTTAAAK